MFNINCLSNYRFVGEKSAKRKRREKSAKRKRRGKEKERKGKESRVEKYDTEIKNTQWEKSR